MTVKLGGSNGERDSGRTPLQDSCLLLNVIAFVTTY